MGEAGKTSSLVFISYSSKNKDTADAVVSDLEQHDIICWYAPRNIRPGEEWVTAITTALERSKVLVLLYTEESNVSRQVMNEIAVAFNAGITIVPFRLSEVPMSSEFEYYLTRVHWLDAVSKPLDQSIAELRDYLKIIISEPEKTPLKSAVYAERTAPGTKKGASGTGEASQSGGEGEENTAKPKKILPKALIAAVILILVLSGLVWGWSWIAKKRTEERNAAYRAARTAYWDLSYKENSAEVTSELTALSKNIPDVCYYLGRICERDGDFAAASLNYEAGIKNGSSLSLLGMGSLYLEGNGVTQDRDRAKEYFDRALSAGCTEANYYEAYLCTSGLNTGEPEDPEKALEYLKEASGSEDKEIRALSALLIGDLCMSGHPGADRTREDAPAYYEKAYIQCPYYKGESYFRTGSFYYSDDQEIALEWFLKAADQGHRRAMYVSGMMYCEGYGTEADEETGKKYYLQSAGLTELEEEPYFRIDPDGIEEEGLYNTLGLIYFYEYDYPHAEALFILEADRFQSATGMANAAIAFENDMDWENALKWYGAAIDAGHPDSIRYQKKIRSMVEAGVVSIDLAKKWL